MECELCGKKTDKLYDVVIEGTFFKVCSECRRFGKIIKEDKIHLKRKSESQTLLEFREKELVIKPNVSKIIRELRENEGLTIEEFSKKYNINSKIIEKLERGEEVDIFLVKRLEKILKIKLTEEVVVHYDKNENKEEDDALTVGDVIIIKQ